MTKRRITDFSDDDEGFCREVDVIVPQHARVSALLGPDGQPLMVGYERPKLGFDLTPRNSARK